MAHNPDSEPHKRKRDISDDNGNQPGHAADRIPQPPPPQSGTFVIHSEVHDSSCYAIAIVRCLYWTNRGNGILLLDSQLSILLLELAELVESSTCIPGSANSLFSHALPPISEIQIF